MNNSPRPYIGRFAPSPTGPLHAGSLVAALASYLDARAHDGRWLIRIEDVDETRTVPGAADEILHTLALFDMHSDGEVVVQSQRTALYAAACARLGEHVYPCGCSRREIADSLSVTGNRLAADGSAIYPGTCRHGLAPGKTARALRLRVPDIGAPDEHLTFNDRLLGLQEQHLATEAGDFVLRRADGFWAYQLAVVVDDDVQGVTHVVRGADLLESSARQIYLQRLLGMPMPAYLHVPVLTNALGEKLSKQTGALALNTAQPLQCLMIAADFLGLELPVDLDNMNRFWECATPAWLRLIESRKGLCG